MKQNNFSLFFPGLGAVSTTFLVGLELLKQKKTKPFGSFSLLGHIPGPNGHEQPVHEVLDLPHLNNIRVGTWDIFSDNAHDAAVKANVVQQKDLEQTRNFLEAIIPMKAVFDPEFVKSLHGTNVKTGSKYELAKSLVAEIREFMLRNSSDQGVMIWCASTEVSKGLSDCHLSLAQFENGLKLNDPFISPSQIYAYAALSAGIPFAMGSPGPTLTGKWVNELSNKTKTPYAGSDFKTGQTYLKNVLAESFLDRMWGLRGWFSTNILGNRDGLVLNDPEAYRNKAESKKTLISQLLSADKYPDLYSNIQHLVNIHYYPPRGDNKEAWDNIDILGWMGYPMEIKINFQCRDSILAAPLLLDIGFFLACAQKSGQYGAIEWLSCFFKTPVLNEPESHINYRHSVQMSELKNALSKMAKKNEFY